MKPIVVLYHKDCSDGFGGAWVARKFFGHRADYIAVEHHRPPPAGLKNKTVYFVDFTYPAAVLKRIIERNRRVIVIDHHVSRAKEAKMAHERLFDIKHSGAALAWKYFFPKKNPPRLIRHIEDRDIWKWKMPGTQEMMLVFDLHPLDFKVWDRLVREAEDPRKRRAWLGRGSAIRGYRDAMVARIVAAAEPVRFAGLTMAAVNTPVFISEVGNRLLKKGISASLMWFEREGKIFVSLRSEGKTDVSKIAARRGGGGHRAAAGFAFPRGKPFPWRRLKK